MNAAHRMLAVCCVCASLGACEREARTFPAPSPPPVPASQEIAAPARTAPPASGPNEQNAYAMSEGKRLFHWYNCAGCHAEGGGDKGPALMDDVWIYGSAPENIYATIVEGRPNGMPAFGGRITPEQTWQIVAYVRSMSGLVASTAAPGRDDAIAAHEPESRAERKPPKDAAPPAPTP